MRLVATLLIAALSASAAALTVTKPEDVGISSKRLERVSVAMRSEIEKGLMPGAVVAIARKGKLVYFESFGFLDKAAGTSMPKDAIFPIASMTKPMVTVGALSLYEENRLLLNDPAGKYLPQIANMRVATERGTEPALRQPTLQDLMRHTAGVTYGNRGESELHKAYSTLSPGRQSGTEFLEALSKLPLHYQPGMKWDYSLGLDVLGLVEEAVTKQRLGDFLNARIWQPLGMTDTAFMVPSSKVNRFAKPLPQNPQTGKAQAFPDPTSLRKMDGGGGGAYSTAADYIRFAEMLRNKGTLDGVQILGRKTVEYMTADQLGPEVNVDQLRTYPNINGYGFGLAVAVRKGGGVAGVMGSPGDFHWAGANGTFFWVDPKEELTVVFMTASPNELRYHFRQVITSAVLQAIAD